MILRRLTDAIRKQNWFQVIVEIMIVVIGIFLGLQVTEWNEERKERIQERIFLNRLHIEVTEGLGYRDENSKSLVRGDVVIKIQNQLTEVLDVLGGFDSQTKLVARHCNGIMASHIYLNPAITLPTVTELLSSGQLSIIHNEEIKLALSKYSLAKETINAVINHLSSVSLVMARKYPDLIELDLRMRGPQQQNQFQHKCNFVQMAQSISFKNDITDNAAKQRSFLVGAEDVREKLQNIHMELDKELGITHEEKT